MAILDFLSGPFKPEEDVEFLDWYSRLADKAEKKDQYAAAINAEYRSGQLAGAFIDRKEVRVTGLEGMSREELESKLKELSEKIDGHNAKTIESEATVISEKS